MRRLGDMIALPILSSPRQRERKCVERGNGPSTRIGIVCDKR